MGSIMNSLFPVKFISDLSKREANSKKPVYAVHKWFGRKTDAIIRSILLSLNLSDDKINNFEKEFYSANPDILKGKLILDPFMGGGITLVNTLRLGGKAIGVDVNPVAWFITKNELQIPKLQDEYIIDYDSLCKVLYSELRKIENAVGNDIKNAYKTNIYDETEKCSREVDIMYILWVKKVICPSCGETIRLFPKMSITKIIRNDFENYNICPNCGELVRGNDFELICSKCKIKFNVNDGNYKSRRFKCNNCNKTFNVLKDVMRKNDKILDMEMYSIEYYDEKLDKKGFKKPDQSDIENFINIKNEYALNRDKLIDFIPLDDIPKGFNTRQIINHNYDFWSKMFNERQLFFLSKLIKEIYKIEHPVVRELFLCVFSNTINANNMFAIYNSQYAKIEPLFGDHHLAPVMTPVENNIWGAKLGRGSFLKNFNIMLQSKKYNYEPFERGYINKKSFKILLKEEKFYGKFTEDFEKLKNKDFNTLIKCQGAEDLAFIPDESIDAVVTDPPYYSAINYGELGEFFYTWQRLALKESYNFYKPNHIVSSNEVTVNTVKGISTEEFQRRLTACFYELHRVLKPEAPLILTYNNSSIEGWSVLFDSLTNSGFIISNAYPIYMEYKAGLIDNRRGKMNYDLVIVANKKTEKHEELIQISEFLIKINKEVESIMKDYSDMDLNKFDKKLIMVGELYKLFSRYSPNIYSAGERVEFKEVIKIMYEK